MADHGLQASGHVDEALDSLKAAGVKAAPFHDFDVNPDADMVERGRQFASEQGPDSIIGLGGGSSLDCAKGINFLLTNGGRMQDYRGYGKATRDLLPMIGIPTTAGTGSEAQSYALISDPDSHEKMACGDPKAAFRAVLLDPALTLSQPAQVTATAGYDAVSHAVESFVTTRRNPVSECYSREAGGCWKGNYERVLTAPEASKPGGPCCWGPTSPGWPSSFPCWAPARLAPTADEPARGHSRRRHRHAAPPRWCAGTHR